MQARVRYSMFEAWRGNWEASERVKEGRGKANAEDAESAEFAEKKRHGEGVERGDFHWGSGKVAVLACVGWGGELRVSVCHRACLPA